MAFVKICDWCEKLLGGHDTFVQTKGTVADQYEPGDGTVQFKYLTSSATEVHTFCNDRCEHEWRDAKRESRQFYNR